ncbi:putative lactoylglutathione lyase [Clostridium argentinense CDC 2741]|uniref:Putative lactoylglutathione lyase n=1 Tax=Clostridium argentinense CDC 2741 TaxID=1418104 RepID=A0A0C1U2W5_9CLOT|nr:putative lactoylglutathione lyase [Clostridium argentinense CDC 2741]
MNNINKLTKKLLELNAEVNFPLTKINNNWVLEFIDSEGNEIEVYCEV